MNNQPVYFTVNKTFYAIQKKILARYYVEFQGYHLTKELSMPTQRIHFFIGDIFFM